MTAYSRRSERRCAMFRWLALSLSIILVQSVGGQYESFGRLSRTEGDVEVLKLGSADWEYGTPNLLVEAGDIVKTGGDDFAEIELENGTFVRMDEVTELRIRYLQRDSDREEWKSAIDVLFGVVRVRTPTLKGWDIEIDVETPTGSITIGEESLIKVIVRRSGASKVIAYSGDVWVTGEWDELCLNAGEAVWISASGNLERPSKVYTMGKDRFDRWCEEYTYVHCESRRYIHTDIYIGVHYLDTYGDWVWMVDCGRVWRPRVRAGWRPYRCGRWTWSVRFGWFWVSYEPWGWVPFHYGRWAYSPHYGWVWVPGNVWGPGWVAWSHGPGWIGWTPLGRGGHPIERQDARTVVASDCFFSRLRTPDERSGYPRYLEANVGSGKWVKEQPGRVVGERQEMVSGRREAHYGRSTPKKIDVTERSSDRDTSSKEKVRTVISRPRVSEPKRTMSRREYSTEKERVNQAPRTGEFERTRTRRTAGARERKEPMNIPNKKSQESVKRSKPRSEGRATQERPSEARPRGQKPRLTRKSTPESKGRGVKSGAGPSKQRH
jgi:hypothetical protein